MKNQIDKNTHGLEEGNKMALRRATQEVMSWLDTAEHAEKEEFESMQKEFEGVCNGITQKQNTTTGGTSDTQSERESMLTRIKMLEEEGKRRKASEKKLQVSNQELHTKVEIQGKLLNEANKRADQLQQDLVTALKQLAVVTHCNLVECSPGDMVSLTASSQIQNSWAKKDAYELGDIVSVHLIENSYLENRYNTYKDLLSGSGVLNGGETLVFHGCTEAAMDPENPDSIVRTGFSTKYWKTSAGTWQRFGPGFYVSEWTSMI